MVEKILLSRELKMDTSGTMRMDVVETLSLLDTCFSLALQKVQKGTSNGRETRRENGDLEGGNSEGDLAGDLRGDRKCPKIQPLDGKYFSGKRSTL